MTSGKRTTRQILTREIILFAGLLFLGVIVLPILIFVVGQSVFGDYDGNGLGGFAGEHLRRLAAGDPATWFLALSPFLGVSILRLMVFGWRQSAPAAR